jgi:ABC-2 type transport system permease protein
MFETITFYENKMVGVESIQLENGKYLIDLDLEVVKYRVDSKGNKIYSDTKDVPNSDIATETKKTPLSLPLADYIDIGIFTKREVNGEMKETELYLKKHKITTIHTKINIIVDQKPTVVGVDPYAKLIEINSIDNRMEVEDKMNFK